MFKTYSRFLALLFVWIFLMAQPADEANGQRKDVNQDESKVPAYTLPDLMTCADGSNVVTKNDWESKRRAEVLALFSDHVYGNFPTEKVDVTFAADSSKKWLVLDGAAIRSEIEMVISNGKQSVTASLLLTLPKTDKPVPCFIGYNFHGNHTTTKDNRVTIPSSWVRNKKQIGSQDNKASEKGRGTSAERWPCAEIIKRGYGQSQRKPSG